MKGHIPDGCNIVYQSENSYSQTIIFDLGIDTTPRYEILVSTKYGIGEGMSYFDPYEEEDYLGYTLLVSDKIPIVNILDNEGNLVEAIFRENTSVEDLFAVGREYINNLTKEKN